MGYIGKIPSAVPLTSADITDNVITSAKIVDGTITNTDIASSIITGQTAETSIAGGDQILIYDDSATALRKMTRTNFVAGIGGTNTPMFHAGRETTGQSVTNGVHTEIVFNVERFDTNSFYNNTNGRFTPTTAGKYFVYSQITIANMGTYYYEFEIRKNGTTETGVYSREFASTNYPSNFNGGIIEFNGTTDYVSVFVYHEHTSARDVYQQNGGVASYFGAYKIIE